MIQLQFMGLCFIYTLSLFYDSVKYNAFVQTLKVICFYFKTNKLIFRSINDIENMASKIPRQFAIQHTPLNNTVYFFYLQCISSPIKWQSDLINTKQISIYHLLIHSYCPIKWHQLLHLIEWHYLILDNNWNK